MTISATSREMKTVRGNATLMLDDPRFAWELLSGTVGIFAVRLDGQSPVGPRRYLFSCNRGDWLFGSDVALSAASMCLLVVGLEDSQLVKRDLAASELGQAEETETLEKLDAWVRRITTGMFSGNSVAHAEILAAQEDAEIAAGQNLKSPLDTVLWMHIISGQLLANGVQLDKSLGTLPVCNELRITAEVDSRITLRQRDKAGSLNELLRGLWLLNRLGFARITQQQLDERLRNSQRLEQRQQRQSQDTSAVFHELGSVLFTRQDALPTDDDLMAALGAIGRAIGQKLKRPARTDNYRSLDDEIEAIARASRVRARHVTLRGHWWHEDSGPILGKFSDDRRPVALLRSGDGYVMTDPATGTARRVDKAIDRQLSRDATVLVRPLPDAIKSLTALGRFAMRPIAPDLLIVVFIASAVTLLGMLVPISTGLIIDEAIPDANISLLYVLSAGLLAMAGAQAALSFSQGRLLLRTDTALTAGLQAAVIDRLLRVPGRFFRRYSSGDLQNRAMMVTEISREVSNTAVSGLLTGAMAALNFFMCFYYSPRLAWMAVAVALIVAAYTAGLSLTIRSMARKLTIGRGLLNGFQIQLVSGVSKLRVAGAQQRAFNAWARRIAVQLRLSAGIQRAEQWGCLINTALQHGTTVCLYYFAARLLTSGADGSSGSAMLSMGTFLAFYAAFNKLIAGVTGVSNTFVELGDSWAKRQLIMPLLEEPPENDDSKVDPGRLVGSISASHIEFRYRDDGPLVLNDVSIHANPGQFIALVGPSGCGKSSLLRILLGFETPLGGSVCFDGQDMASLDGTAVRRQIGVVLQSGIVNSGSIFDNIAGSSRVTLEKAWEAARAAGLAEDVEKMPMGMHTVISEGGGTLSGGQRQRLLIARALVTRPKILIFDEATSALDNRTQQIVSESLDRLQVTRVVVAHRLSTIRQADRIYVMEGGQIVQSGTFDELAAQEGLFRRMIARQLV